MFIPMLFFFSFCFYCGRKYKMPCLTDGRSVFIVQRVRLFSRQIANTSYTTKIFNQKHIFLLLCHIIHVTPLRAHTHKKKHQTIKECNSDETKSFKQLVNVCKQMDMMLTSPFEMISLNFRFKFHFYFNLLFMNHSKL